MTANHPIDTLATTQETVDTGALSSTTLTRCSHCGQGYKVAAVRVGEIAHCRKCGAAFSIRQLARRHKSHRATTDHPKHRSPARGMTEIMCSEHPNISAKYICVGCFRPMCDACHSYPADGQDGRLCLQCALEANAVLARADESPNPGPASMSALPNPAHACGSDKPTAPNLCESPYAADPSSGPQTRIGKRLGCLIWSYLLAAWTTMAMALFLIGASVVKGHSMERAQVLGFGATVFVLVPAILGIALALAAKNGQCDNQTLARSALVWNGILVAVCTALIAFGLVTTLIRM